MRPTEYSFPRHGFLTDITYKPRRVDWTPKIEMDFEVLAIDPPQKSSLSYEHVKTYWTNKVANPTHQSKVLLVQYRTRPFAHMFDREGDQLIS